MVSNKQSGFSAFEAVLAVVIVGALVLVGWWFYQMQSDPVENKQDTAQVSDVPKIDSSDDLKEAEEYLNNTNLDEQFDTGEMEAVLQ